MRQFRGKARCDLRTWAAFGRPMPKVSHVREILRQNGRMCARIGKAAWLRAFRQPPEQVFHRTVRREGSGAGYRSAHMGGFWQADAKSLACARDFAPKRPHVRDSLPKRPHVR